MRTTKDVKEEYKAPGLRSSLQAIKDRAGDTPLVGCELGVDVCNNANSILSLMNISTLHLVDSFARGKIYEPCYLPYGECKERLAEYKDKVVYHIGNTKGISKDFTDSSLDFVYVDADHSYECCREDMLNYWPKVKNGGVLAGHDLVIEGVKKAVNQFCEENKVTHESNGNDWWILKGG